MGCHHPASVFPMSGCSKRVTWCPPLLRRWHCRLHFPTRLDCRPELFLSVSPVGASCSFKPPEPQLAPALVHRGAWGWACSLSGLHDAADFTVTSSDAVIRKVFMAFSISLLVGPVLPRSSGDLTGVSQPPSLLVSSVQ